MAEQEDSGVEELLHLAAPPDPSSSSILPSLYEFVIRTTTFLITYLIYLLILFIVLDFWDKLKQPTKQFLREKMVKYVGVETLVEYLKLNETSRRTADQPAVDTKHGDTAGPERPAAAARSTGDLRHRNVGGHTTMENTSEPQLADMISFEDDLPAVELQHPLPVELQQEDEGVDTEDTALTDDEEVLQDHVQEHVQEDDVQEEHVQEDDVQEEHVQEDDEQEAAFNEEVGLFVRDTISKAMDQCQSEAAAAAAD